MVADPPILLPRNSSRFPDAVYHHSARKTRVNALMALRRARETRRFCAWLILLCALGNRQALSSP